MESKTKNILFTILGIFILLMVLYFLYCWLFPGNSYELYTLPWIANTYTTSSSSETVPTEGAGNVPAENTGGGVTA